MSSSCGHLLVVDDDDRLRSLLTRYLSGEGFSLTAAADALSARKLLGLIEFDLVILDVMMPGEDGFSLLGDIRKRVGTPVIFLTARSDTEDRIAGLKVGADDYLAKPFEPEELLLRIKSILRRAVAEELPSVVHLSGLVFDLAKGDLRKGGRPIRLTEAEAFLLRILAARGGEPVSRLELARLTSAGVERTVDVQVTRLRRKIEPNPREPIHLQTVRGVGYRLAGD